MSNEAVVAAPPVAPGAHQVTLANGTVVTDQMSPTERYNAVAVSLGEKPAARPPGIYFGPEVIHHGAQAAKAPSSSKPDALPPSVVVPPQGTPEVDQQFIVALQKAYAALPPSKREAKRQQYEAELREGFEGRKLGENRADFHARKTGTAPAAPTAQPAAPEEVSTEAALDVATKESNKYGWAPASAITGPLLHGYTVPQDREYNVADLVAGLRQAKAIGLTQAQVDAYIKGGA